jgi:hypothetical protein
MTIEEYDKQIKALDNQIELVQRYKDISVRFHIGISEDTKRLNADIFEYFFDKINAIYKEREDLISSQTPF